MCFSRTSLGADLTTTLDIFLKKLQLELTIAYGAATIDNLYTNTKQNVKILTYIFNLHSTSSVYVMTKSIAKKWWPFFFEKFIVLINKSNFTMLVVLTAVAVFVTVFIQNVTVPFGPNVDWWTWLERSQQNIKTCLLIFSVSFIFEEYLLCPYNILQKIYYALKIKLKHFKLNITTLWASTHKSAIEYLHYNTKH